MNTTHLSGVEPRPMYVSCVSCAWVGPEPYVKTKYFVSYSFDSVSEACKSKEGYLQTPHFVPYTTQAPDPDKLDMFTKGN